MAPAAIMHRKDLSLSGAAGPVLVKAPKSILVLVLRNLIDNGLRHTPSGTRVNVDVDAGGVIRITDSGPGVPAGDRERIFDRFWRAQRNRASGAGLGLAIVKRFVDLVGGEISVDNAPGGGACFSVRFQLSDDA